VDILDVRIVVLAVIAIAGLIGLLVANRYARNRDEPPEGGGYSLTPCPFCGRRHIILVHDEAKDLYRARCPGCHALGPYGINYTKAADRWNDRTLRIDI